MSLIDEAPETTEKKKKGTKKDESPNEGSSEPSETQKEKKSEMEGGKKDKIKAFARKGAGAKSVVDPNSKASEKDGKRNLQSVVIESIVRPSGEQVDENQLFNPPSETRIDRPLPVIAEKRRSQAMLEEMLKREQEDQALASLVLNLVKKRRSETAEKAKFVLSEEETLKRSRNMSPLEQAGIICVLEETIAKLNVLGYTQGKPVVRQEIKYTSFIDKLGEKEGSRLVDLILSNKPEEEYEIEKHFIKLQTDRGFLEEALTLTLLEMKETGTFKILQDIIHLEEEIVKEEEDLRFNGRNRQQEVNHCKALLERERSRAMKRLDDRTALLATLKDEIQNLLYYNGLKYKYMDHWESSRTEQNAMMLQNSQKELDKKLSDFEELSHIELRVNAEIVTFIEKNIQLLNDMVEEWMARYDSEMEEREYKLGKLKEEREAHFKELQEQIELFNERQRKIDEWKAYKERLRLEAEYQELLVRMAIRIQAWWRGTMVRKHLGPYKKKGKKRRKKKK